jgi:secondary thiamine-phosphate synthase enzyme
MKADKLPRLRVRSSAREELVDISAHVREAIAASGVRTGTAHLWSLHTTCGLTVNEGADPDVARDLVAFMRTLVPRDSAFRHDEGNSDAHVKTSLFGPGLTLLVEDAAPLLGRWQKIFLAEWDGPRTREIAIHVHGQP